MSTCSETICKHRILFPCIQHLALLPQGRLQGKPKCGKKIMIFGLMHWLKHRITRKVFKIDRYMLRGVWQALNELSFHPWNILGNNCRGVSRGNKNVGCGTWKRRFFALAVRITGKLLKIYGYMLRGVWQALNFFSFMQRFAWLPQGRPQGKQKIKAGVRKNDDFLQLWFE